MLAYRALDEGVLQHTQPSIHDSAAYMTTTFSLLVNKDGDKELCWIYGTCLQVTLFCQITKYFCQSTIWIRPRWQCQSSTQMKQLIALSTLKTSDRHQYCLSWRKTSQG